MMSIFENKNRGRSQKVQIWDKRGTVGRSVLDGQNFE